MVIDELEYELIDLSIELNKLYSLYEASTILDHAVKEIDRELADWRPFSPSRFIYSYFTFNSIYGFDWQNCVEKQSAINWEPDEKRRLPNEIDQIKPLLKFCLYPLEIKTPVKYSQLLKKQLSMFSISDPFQFLEKIDSSNESKKTKGLRKAFPGSFKNIYYPNENLDVFYSSLCSVIHFIKDVRNNIFHGTKTRIEMQDTPQQTRLLIYTSVINAINGLFFLVIESKDIDWKKVPVNFISV